MLGRKCDLVTAALGMLLAVGGAAAQTSTAVAGEALPVAPRLVSGPTVKAEGQRALISFEVAAPVDVAVEIIDGQGRIVRHLGAGALGDNAPPPFKKGSLAQVVAWDGLDDAGKQVRGGDAGAAGGLSARVRLGLQATFDRYIAKSDKASTGPLPPDLAAGQINGIAADQDGNLFLIVAKGIAGISGRTENRIVQLTPEGEYVRSLLPFSRNTDPAALSGVRLLSSEKGRLKPCVYEHVCTPFMPDFESFSTETMAMTGDGRLVMASGWRTELYGFGPRRLLLLNRDGSVPGKQPNGPVIGPDGVIGGFAHVAIGPKDEYAYVTGLHRGRYYEPSKTPQDLLNAVYKVKLDPDAKGTVFFGEEYKGGSDEGHLQEPRGIAADDAGTVYVSDFYNDRIVKISPEGKFAGAIPVDGPCALAIHPKRRDIYLVTMPKAGGNFMVKLAPDGGEVWRDSFGKLARDRYEIYHPAIGISWRGEKTQVFIGSSEAGMPYRLLRYTDLGKSFEKRDLIKSRSYPLLYGVESVSLDDRLHLRSGRGRSQVEDGATVKRTAWWPGYYDPISLGNDGCAYLMKKVVKDPWPGAYALSRFRIGGDKTAVPFPATGEFTKHFESLWEFRRDNLFTTPRGDMYLLHYLSGGKGAGRGGGDAEVIHIRPDGTIADKPLVTKLLAPASVKVDSRGYIYVAENLKPPGYYWPKEMDGFISSLPKKVQTEYGELYGSVLKFKPEGGTVVPAGPGAKAPEGARELHLCVGEKKYYVTGLADVYVGTAPRPPVRTGFRSKCWCLSGSIDLDLHDRLYVPDSGCFTVRVLDSNFNEILSIGSYGSVDDPVGPTRSGDDIPLECPTDVFASDRAVYIKDQAPAAERSMRVKLGYALERDCPIP